MKHVVYAAILSARMKTYLIVNLAVADSLTLSVSCDALNTINRKVNQCNAHFVVQVGAKVLSKFCKKTRNFLEIRKKKQLKGREKLI